MSYARYAKIRKDNKTGYKGVSLSKSTGRFVASIKIDGKKRQLGTYATPEEASAAYLRAVKKYVQGEEPLPPQAKEEDDRPSNAS